jgi:putative ABC transport system substrate-binding protein
MPGLLATYAAFALLTAAAIAGVPKVGVLVRPQASAPYEAGLRDGLRELGYVEGRNIVVDWRRSAGGDEDASVAASLARSNLDVVVVFSTPGARAAMEANGNVPIVFLSGIPWQQASRPAFPDPVRTPPA